MRTRPDARTAPRGWPAVSVRPILLVALLGTAPIESALAQLSFCRYDPGTLADVIARAKPMADTLGGVLALEQNRTRADVVYRGESRPLTSVHRQLIELYGRTLVHQRLDTLYHAELRFVEQGRSFWLPVQDRSAQSLASEVKAGDSLMVFTVLIGGFVYPDSTDWLLAITEFQSRDPKWQWFRRACGGS